MGIIKLEEKDYEQLTRGKQMQVVAALVDGNSIRATRRGLGVTPSGKRDRNGDPQALPQHGQEA